MQMKDLKLKLRFFIAPFLLIAFCFIAGYTLLHWLLIIKTGVVNIKQDVITLWLPLALAFIPVLIWINPRLRLLNLNSGKNNLPTLYVLVAAGTIGATTLITQQYLSVSTGKLTSLQSINQFDNNAKTKYYKLSRYYIDKSNVSIHSTANISGKNNQYLNYHFYLVVPIYESQTDTATRACSNWLGIHYSKQVSNRLSDTEKDSRHTKFAVESQKKFDTADLARFVYLERLGNTDDHDEFNEAINKTTLGKNNDPQVFISINENFENRAGGKSGWIFKSFGIGFLVWLIMIAIPKLNRSELKKLQQGKTEKGNELKEMLSMLVPKPGYFATPVIMNLNLAIFLIMVFAGFGFISFRGQDLLSVGGNFRPSVLRGEWWRLLTNVFLHGGLMHIFVNMFSLLLVGIFLEPVLGTKRFTIFYLLCGILASCASIWWYTHTVSVGASGAIFGLYGIFLGLLLRKVFPPAFSRVFLVSILIFTVYNLVMGLTGGIDNAAHIGGLVSGFLIGLIVAPTINRDSVSSELVS
jgi:rhomboid protease GluP